MVRVSKHIQAKNYTKTNGRDIRVIVLHTMESPEHPATAEAVAAWFAGRTAPRASTHYNIDSNSIVRSVYDRDVAWCAPGKNHDGLHIEHAGRASQNWRGWNDPFSTKMLLLSAEFIAQKCKRYGIPIRRLTVAQVRAGTKGICGHIDVTRAWPNLGSHTDPGKDFPWTRYMKYTKQFRIALN